MITYGAVKWGFKLRAGLVQDEYLTPVDAASATFTEALERHRDFYVHEPVTFYFGFDKDTLDATETGKIDDVPANLTRNATVSWDRGLRRPQGQRETTTSTSRCGAPRPSRPRCWPRASTRPGSIRSRSAAAPRPSATTDAGTGDQGGDAAVGADQNREANRWANRRVVLTFSTPTPSRER